LIARWSSTTRRRTFVVYAIILFTLTHWPGLGIQTDLGRPDLVVHTVVFGLWTILLIACQFFGPPGSWRNIAICAPIAVAYACIDESLQAIPFVNRHAGVDDALANLLGVSLGVLTMSLIARHRRRRSL
jgi:VanZ family protein